MIRPPHRMFGLAYGGGLALVAVLSLVPRVDVPGPEGSDKFAHLLAYGAISLCGALAARDWSFRILAATTAVGAGILLEVAQSAWAMRDGNVADALANTGGAAIGLALAWAVLARFADKSAGRPLS